MTLVPHSKESSQIESSSRNMGQACRALDTYQAIPAAQTERFELAVDLYECTLRLGEENCEGEPTFSGIYL